LIICTVPAYFTMASSSLSDLNGGGSSAKSNGTVRHKTGTNGRPSASSSSYRTNGGSAANGGAVNAGDWSLGRGALPGRDVLGPLLLMLTTPAFAIVFWHVMKEGKSVEDLDWIG